MLTVPLTPVEVAASLPWAFTQKLPLTTSEFCAAASKRAVDFSEDDLRELWRAGALLPFVEVRNRPLRPPTRTTIAEPAFPGGTELRELRRARERGCLIDPAHLGFRHQLRLRLARALTRPRERWWNGLLYSHWQLLDIQELGG